MKLKNNNSGFTLLEIIIVIIILGVLASLALPRFLKTSESSKGAESLQVMTALRTALEAHFAKNNTYGGAVLGTAAHNLMVDDPANAANPHFTYGLSNLSATRYTITATRNTADGGDGVSTIATDVNGGTTTRTGTTPFVGI